MWQQILALIILEEQGTEKSSPYPNGLSMLSRANKPNREDRTKVLPVLWDTGYETVNSVVVTGTD